MNADQRGWPCAVARAASLCWNSRGLVARATLVVLLFTGASVHAQATRPATRSAPRREPPPLTAAEKAEVAAGAKRLADAIDDLRVKLKGKPDLLALLPDVQIYHNALRYPVEYGDACDVRQARRALAAGLERATRLAEGRAPWLAVSGPRGYISELDGSVQPYHLVVPAGFDPKATKKQRLDFFLHGRDEGLTELKFLSMTPPAAADHLVVHPYGRYCNAFKFAGEIDVLEVLRDLKLRLPIDEDRVVMMGFSMGGGGAWHLTAHYAGLFAASSPGAGFAETPEYARLLAKKDRFPWYEWRLFRLYDATGYAANFGHCPTVAYAGELDGQIQASEIMAKAMAAEGLKLERLIGPNTKHEYHKETRRRLDARLADLAHQGRDRWPEKVSFTTYTLRYNTLHWVTIDGLERHWERADVTAQIYRTSLGVKTRNVSAVTFSLPAGRHPYAAEGKSFAVTIDGQRLPGSPVAEGRPWVGRFVKGADGKWGPYRAADEPVLRKRHGLQGPIDDAFMGPFLIVRPTGKASSDATGRWAASECDEAIKNWRRHFRGEARVKDDVAVTAADIDSYHLVCFGDASSNAVIAKMAGRLPATWAGGELRFGGKAYAADRHLPLLIYPNPLNPRRYVVLNSGVTFRAWPVSNALQTPKLPDYAIVDVSRSGTVDLPAAVVRAGFFDETWRVRDGDDGGK